MRRALPPCALLASAALLGCAGPGSATQASPSAISRAETTHEYSTVRPPRQHADSTATSAVQAIRQFATAYISWSAATVATHLQALALASVGQARAAMELAAAGAARDYELRRGGVANSGTVEAVARLAGTRDQYVVVTRELTTAASTNAYQGLRPAWHVTLATVTEVAPGQWVLSGWQPES